MTNYKYEEQTGRSMIEMLGVLAIIGVLSVGGIAGYSKAMNKFKTNKVADNVSMLVANIKTLYAQQNTYDGLTNATAVSMGVVPDELGTTENLTNAFSGPVYINVAGSTTKTDKKAFVIEFQNLSREACITLATNDWGSGYSSGLIAIRAASDSSSGRSTALDEVYIGDAGTDVGGSTSGGSTSGGSTSGGSTSGGSTSGGSAQMESVKTQSIVAPQAGNTSSGTGVSAIATPGGSTLSVPMKVSTAATACGCTTGNKCSIQWKYY